MEEMEQKLLLRELNNKIINKEEDLRNLRIERAELRRKIRHLEMDKKISEGQ